MRSCSTLSTVAEDPRCCLRDEDGGDGPRLREPHVVLAAALGGAGLVGVAVDAEVDALHGKI